MQKKLKASLLRPFMKLKWWATKRKNERSVECRTVREILGKRDELYTRYLKQSREGDVSGSNESKSFMKALDWMIMSKDEK